MKTVQKKTDGSLKRVPDKIAAYLVHTKGTHTYVPKKVWKENKS